MEATCEKASSEPFDMPFNDESNPSTAQPSLTAQDMETGTEHVENAVAVIEQGIRKLAGMLKGELHDQWTRAHKTLEEVDSSRAKIDTERESTREMLKEIACLRDDARIARDEAVLARDEARQDREAARVAKERAETSAAAAELAADHATREAKTLAEADPPDAQS